MSSMFFIFAIIVVIVIVAAVVKVLIQKGKGPAEYPYQKEPTLLSPAERSFLGVLEQAVGNQFRIMAKVRLADVIRVKPGLDRSERQKAFNRIQSKHLDFVCCDPSDLSVRIAVELDDKSHDRQDRQDRDAFLDTAIEKAGVPLVRFTAQRTYSIQDVRDTVLNRLSAPLTPTATLVAAPVSQPVAPPAVAANTKCPSCGGDMIRRKAAKGPNAGQEFWGCSNYPKCKKILPI